MIEIIYYIIFVLILFYIFKYTYNYEYFQDIHHYNLDRDVIPQQSNNLSIEVPINDNYLSHQVDIEDFDNIDVVYDYKIIDQYKKILPDWFLLKDDTASNFCESFLAKHF